MEIDYFLKERSFNGLCITLDLTFYSNISGFIHFISKFKFME